jgi:hypothetical protein
MTADPRDKLRRAVEETFRKGRTAVSDALLTPNIVIRQFTMDDYECVRQLWEEQGVRLDPSLSREGIARRLERCSSDLFLVAENRGMLLGVVVASWDGQQGWISHQAVDPTSRRLGIGSKLVEEVERHLKALGARRVALLVSRDNLMAQDFYQHRGFHVEEDQILMTKDL